LRIISRLFAVVFFVGFIAMALALGYGALAENLWLDHPFAAALRYFGLGLMAAGLAMWVIDRRYEANKEGLNPLLWLLLAGAILALVPALVFANSLGGTVHQIGLIGLGFAVASLLIAVIAQIVSPALPRGLTTRWPGETASSEPSHSATSDVGHAPDQSAH
jgi:vacuolar-type H+-ATPase subunit I/STV1